MPQTFTSLRINPDRMLASFTQLASIGGTADSGVDRPTFSEAHLAARIHEMGRLCQRRECVVAGGAAVGERVK